MALKENYSELYKDETVHRKAKNKRDKFEIAFKKLLDETFSDVQANKRKVTKTIDIKQ
jgi:hypothetical protein